MRSQEIVLILAQLLRNQVLWGSNFPFLDPTFLPCSMITLEYHMVVSVPVHTKCTGCCESKVYNSFIYFFLLTS